MNWRDIWLEPRTGRMRSGWRVVIFVLIVYPVSQLCFDLFSLGLPANLPDPFLRQFVSQLILALAEIPAYLSVSIWAVRVLDRLPARTLGLMPEGPWLPRLGAGFAAGVLMIAVVLGAMRAGGLAGIQWHVPTQRESLVLVLAAASCLLFAAHFEIIFRGYLFQTLLRGAGPLITLLLTSVLFAAQFAPNTGSTPIFLANMLLLSLLSGLLYLRSGSLWLPIGLQAGWNFAQLLFQVNISGISTPVVGLLPTRITGLPLLTGGAFGPEGGCLVSVLALAAIGVAAWTARGLPLASNWWEWRNLLAVARAPQVWDFSIDGRYYQWKLLERDPAE